MRFSWFSRRPERRRRGAAVPLAVRRLERRRVLNAQITSMVVPAMVAEGDTVTTTATGTGFGQLYFFWSVKQSSTTIASGSGPTFDFTALDDGTYDVKLQLYDSAQGNDTEIRPLVVTNVAPQITNLTALNVNENSFTTLTGSIVDPGTKDTFTLDVDWGDGTVETFTYAAGTKDFSETHQYLDDNPTGTPSDPYTINVKLKDDDTDEDVD
ncbi:MAG: hypothetical protein L0Z07_00840, partial [Planctomycetes bacterium]|nr:hypothetical protein [Planctomycetota bacterium]